MEDLLNEGRSTHLFQGNLERPDIAQIFERYLAWLPVSKRQDCSARQAAHQITFLECVPQFFRPHVCGSLEIFSIARNLRRECFQGAMSLWYRGHESNTNVNYEMSRVSRASTHARLRLVSRDHFTTGWKELHLRATDLMLALLGTAEWQKKRLLMYSWDSYKYRQVAHAALHYV